jgi:hypothetical protein
VTPLNTVVGGKASTCAPHLIVSGLRFAHEVGPLDFARILHPKGGTGQVAFGGPVATRKVDAKGHAVMTWTNRRWSPHALATRSSVDIAGARFITMATYRYHERGQPKPKKSEANIVGIGSNWVDLDSYKEEAWRDVPPSVIREVILNVCEDLGLPVPTLINFSGRGHLVVWQYQAQAWALIAPRWKAVQKTLHERFLFLGSDRSGKSPTKWFRLPGTRNERSGQQVGMVWPPVLADVQRTTFDRLAAAVLPHARQTKAERLAAEAETAAKRLASLANRKPRVGLHGAKLGGRSYWDTISTDLEKLFALRFGTGPIPDGEGRNTWCLMLAYAASWRMPAKDLAGYIREQAARCGLEEHEAIAKTVTVVQHAGEAAQGIKKIWVDRRGPVPVERKVDPRYRPSPAHFVEELGIKPREMKKADLRMLVDKARQKANAKERVTKSRRAAGVGSRDVSQDTRREVGRVALEMRAEGLKNREVLQVFGIEQRYLDTCLCDARVVADIGSTAKPTKVVKVSPAAAPVVEPEACDVIESPALADAFEGTHEVLRGTRESGDQSVDVLVADSATAYSAVVTMVGTSLHRGRTPAESPPARRAFSCPAPVLATVEACA